MQHDAIAIFALGAAATLGKEVAVKLDLPLAEHEERDFEDGEHKMRPISAVYGRDVYVLSSLYSDQHRSVNDRLVRLLFFLATLRDAGAGQVTAVLPYMCYARKDARTQPDDPLTSRYAAQLLEATGATRVVAFEVHNPAAFQNSFRIRAEHIACTAPLADFACAQIRGAEGITVVSPDPGGFKRAQRLRSVLMRRLGCEVGLAFVEKTRALGKMSSGRLVGAVADTTAIIVDDIVASGGTLYTAAETIRAAGAKRVLAAAAHGLFIGAANRLLAGATIERIAITDSIPPFRLDAKLTQERVSILPLAPLIAATIQRLHGNTSLADLSA